MAGTVVVIGGSNVDIEGKASSEIRPFDSNIGSVIYKPGGVGRNIAENLARLEIDSILISAIGNDSQGKWLKDRGRQSGINMDHLFISQKLPTSTYLSILDQRGEMQVAINDMGILDELTPAVLAQRKEQIEAADIILIDCNLNQQTVDYLFHTYHEKTIFVDPVSTTKIGKISDHLKHITLLKPNLLEATAVSGIESSSESVEVFNWFHKRGVKQIMLSLGRDGGCYSDGKICGRCHIANDQPIVSGTGAGDAMMAGLILGHLRNLNMVNKTQIGLAAAYITIHDAATVSPNMNLHNVEKMVAQLNFNCKSI